MKGALLACDVGTSNCKLAMYDTAGTLIAAESRSYPTSYPHDGWAEQDPDDWWTAFCEMSTLLVQQATANEYGLLSIAVVGQMSACLPVDGDGNVLHNAMIWTDRRAIEEARFLRDAIGYESFYELTGNPPDATYPVAKILWLRRHHPELYRRTRVFLQPKDYIVHRLTGQFTTDFSDASCTGMMHIRSRMWDSGILAELGINDDLLPPLMSSADIAGHVTPSAAARCCIPAGTPVVAGGGDGPASALGVGVIAPGHGYVNLGTSAWLSFSSTTPVTDEGRTIVSYCHVVPGQYALTASTQNSGNVIDWYLGRLMTDADQLELRSRYDDAFDAVSAVEPGCNGLLFLPYLHGERCPYWDPRARGAVVGLSPSDDRNSLFRAMVEGLCYHLRLMLELFQQLGLSSAKLPVIGGGARNRVLCSMISDVTGREIIVPSLSQGATSLGAAVCAALGSGVLSTFEDAKEWLPGVTAYLPHTDKRYDDQYDRFRRAYTQLKPLFHSYG